MKRTIKVTLTRLYKKEVVVEVNNEKFANMTEEEIADALMNNCEVDDEDKLFEKAELQQIDFNEEVMGIDADTDRYDIYNEEGEQIYGGHL